MNPNFVSDIVYRYDFDERMIIDHLSDIAAHKNESADSTFTSNNSKIRSSFDSCSENSHLGTSGLINQNVEETKTISLISLNSRPENYFEPNSNSGRYSDSFGHSANKIDRKTTVTKEIDFAISTLKAIFPQVSSNDIIDYLERHKYNIELTAEEIGKFELDNSEEHILISGMSSCSVSLENTPEQEFRNFSHLSDPLISLVILPIFIFELIFDSLKFFRIFLLKFLRAIWNLPVAS